MASTASNLKPEPKARSARNKAETTDAIAYAIIDAEAAARKDKTARLRALRQQQEAAVPLPDKSAAAAKRRRAAAKKRKA